MQFWENYYDFQKINSVKMHKSRSRIRTRDLWLTNYKQLSYDDIQSD